MQNKEASSNLNDVSTKRRESLSLESIFKQIEDDFKEVKIVKKISNNLAIDAGIIILAFYIAPFILVLLGVYPGFVSSFFCLPYPFFKTMQFFSRLESPEGNNNISVNQEEKQLWMSYWITLAIVLVFESQFKHFKLYFYIGKILFAAYLSYPKQTYQMIGAHLIYRKFWMPLFLHYKQYLSK